MNFHKSFKIILIFISIIFSKHLESRKFEVKKKLCFIEENFKNTNWLNKNNWLNIVPLRTILNKNSQIQYQKIVDKVYFHYPQFSIAPNFPNQGYFDELSIMFIPNGMVQGDYGYVFIGNQTPQELVWSQRYNCINKIPKLSDKNLIKVSGKVAVITQFGYNNYFHWINEILGRLAILEIANIEYDWLYVPYTMKYAKETLELWGIDTSKIISPDGTSFCLEVDELIVPSLVSNTTTGHNHAGTLVHPIIMNYVRDKLLKAAFAQSNIYLNNLPKKIFISRKDSYAIRKILNEDEIFELFEKQGFVRYELSKLSVLEQILLFANADIVVSEQGSGLANILFCRPQTKVIEIFQAMIDNCFWWQSSVLNLEYHPYLTVPVKTNIFEKCNFGELYHHAWLSQINISLEPIKEIIKLLESE